MSRRKTLLIGILTALSAGLVYQACVKAGTEPHPDASGTKHDSAETHSASLRQPMEFDHEAHIKAEDMECTDCHKMATKSPFASIPRIKDCADCHSEPQGKHPDEPKVREYLEENKEIAWKTVNKLPGHVYFSHRAHVVFGEMKCWDCHGDLRKISKTVTESDVGHLTMRKCMNCHEEKQAENECTTCHK